MNEVFPILAGAVVGLLVLRLEGARARAIALVVLSVLIGVTASFISGELFVSWDFVFVDIPQVFVAAAATTLAVNWWQRRRVPRA